MDERFWDLATIIPEAKIPDGYPVPISVIESILYATCNDVGDNGERKTLSKMNTIEASRYFDKCRNYAAIRWHIQIDDPNSEWNKKRENDKTNNL